MILGPFVLFFQSLASFNGLISDITPILPNFSDLWNASKFHPNSDYARQIPIPTIILDQLYHFAAFWNSVFSAAGFTRVNAAATPYTSIDNLHGFKNQFGDSQINWFIELMPPERGSGARAATLPRVRPVSPVVSNETSEMAMFEEFRRFQEYKHRESVMRRAPEVNVPHRGGPDVEAPPQHQPQPSPHPMHAHGQGSSYMEAIKYLKDVDMEFFGGKFNPIAADN
ncbi:unnamed protein product [Arabidopsis arenosa]|uniref:Uncharacterized protein n=1 Tax=Arabidopsis arenosa TaxID=38785 RepID=A0A8S2AN66_ARAAE|nr:unnamed protein product [Arabidopsis arenosa]